MPETSTEFPDYVLDVLKVFLPEEAAKATVMGKQDLRALLYHFEQGTTANDAAQAMILNRGWRFYSA